MSQARDEAGNIWEVDAQGNAIRLIQPAGGQRGMILRDPKAQYAAPTAEAGMRKEQAAADYAAPTARAGLDATQATTATTNAKLPYVPAIARAEAAKGGYDAEKSRLEVEEKKRQIANAPDPAQADRAKSLSLDEVMTSINNARGQISGWSTGFGGKHLRGFGGTQADDLAASLSTVGSHITQDVLSQLKSQSATGASGFGALSEREGEMLRNSVAALSQDQSADQLRKNLDAVELHYRRLRAVQEGQDPSNPQTAKQYGYAGLPGSGVAVSPSVDDRQDRTRSFYADPGSGGTEHTYLANGRMQSVADPASEQAGKHLSHMLASGAPDEAVRAYAAQVGANADASLKFREENPGYRGGYPTKGFGFKNVPVGALEAALATASQDPIGTGFAQLGNAAVGNQIPNLVGLAGGNRERTRLGFDATAAANPRMAIAGSLLGAAAGTAGLEAGAARIGLGASPWAARGADALYGALSGEGAAPAGQEGIGSAIGGAAGLGGGIVGRALARGLGTAARGVTDADVNYLSGEGVRMTGGQMAGGAAKHFEDLLTGYPVIGGIVKRRRDEALTDYNRAMFRQGAEGAPIADIGERGAEQLDQAVTNAYAPLNGLSASVDPQLGQDLAAAASAGRAIPGRADDFNHIVNTRVVPNFDANGTMSGSNLQDTLQQLRRAAAGQGMAAMHADDFSSALGNVEGALTGMFQRQAPEAVDTLAQGNRLYTNQSIIDSAVKAARNQRGPDGDALVMPSQLNTASVMNTNRYGGPSRAATTDRPFYDLATSGQAVLPSRVADSGTAGRAAIAAALAATGAGAGTGYATDGSQGAATGGAAGAAVPLSIAALLAAGGSRTGQNLVARALLDRPDVLRRAGLGLLENSSRASIASVPLALEYTNSIQP